MGRKYLTLIIIGLLFLISPLRLNAQFVPAPVEKSTQKILYQKKVYYIHKVEPNQTIHSISRAYGVTYQDIAVANPNIKLETINPGQILKIPEISSLDTLSESYYGLNKNDFYYHTVESQQTVTYLTQKYNVPKELIYKYNPGSEDVIQIGQVIKIPKPHLVYSEVSSTPDTSDSSNKYEVKTGDTLYSLAKLYGVSVADFIEENPDLRWGLKAGMTLTIPGLKSYISTETNIYDSIATPWYNGIKLFSQQECDSVQQINHSPEIKIALMLPFYVEETLALDTILNDSLRNAHPYNRLKSIGESFMEFYQGFLIALDSIKTSGSKATVFTYDTKYDTNEIDNILRELEIIQPDIIFGPVFSENIKRVSAFSDSNKIPLILPLSKANYSLTKNNPYAVTLMPDFNTELDLAANFLSQFYNKNIILIHNQDTARMDNLDVFKKSLFAHFSSNESYEKALFKELRTNDTLNRNLTHTLREDIENVVIIVSNNEAFVSNVVGLLTIQDPVYKIRVFGLPSWQKFKNLRVDQLHSLNTTLYTPFFIDYTKPSTQRFIQLSRKKLGYEPYRTVSNGSGFNFSYLGYETGLLFSKAFIKYGPSFINCMCTVQENLPQLNYEFIYNTWGGFRINAINIINYSEDYELLKIPFSGTTSKVIQTKDSGVLVNENN